MSQLPSRPIYEAKEGETVWSLTKKILGSRDRWRELKRANNLGTYESYFFVPGQRVAIPFSWNWTPPTLKPHLPEVQRQCVHLSVKVQNEQYCLYEIKCRLDKPVPPMLSLYNVSPSDALPPCLGVAQKSFECEHYRKEGDPLPQFNKRRIKLRKPL